MNTPDNPTQLRLRFDDAAELDELKQLASSVGLSAQEGSEDSGELSSDIEPVTMLLIGGGVLAAAKFLTDWLDKRQGGMVVDQRPGADNEVRRDKGVPAGYVVVFPKDGGKAQISIHDQPKDAVERLLADIVSGAFSTSAELAKAAGAALGEGADVETVEADA